MPDSATRLAPGVDDGPQGTLAPAPKPSPTDRRIPSIGHAVLFLLALFLTQVAIALAWTIAVVVLEGFSGEKLDAFTPSSTSWRLAVLNFVSFALALAAAKHITRRPWHELLALRKYWRPGLIGLVPISLGLAIVMSELTYLLCYVLPPPEFINRAMTRLFEDKLSAFVTIIIVAPLTEEFFFRGFLINGFRKRYSRSTTIVTSAAMFALFHINPYQMPNAFVLGLVLAWLRLRSGSVWPCVALHALSNAWVLLAMVFHLADGSRSVDALQLGPSWLVLGGFGLSALGVVTLRRYLSPPAS